LRGEFREAVEQRRKIGARRAGVLQEQKVLGDAGS